MEENFLLLNIGLFTLIAITPTVVTSFGQCGRLANFTNYTQNGQYSKKIVLINLK